jgi:hypothetical protein
MFEHSASNHSLEEVVFMGQQIRMGDLRVLQPGELVEHGVLFTVYVALVKFDLCSSMHPNQTCIYGMTTSPVKDSTGFSEKLLAALKDADLPGYKSKISGMVMKVMIFFDLSLDGIKIGQLDFPPAPSATCAP